VPLVRRETTTEYFKELVEGALARQQLTVDELTSWYVVNMLDAFTRAEVIRSFYDEPLAFEVARAFEQGRFTESTALRRVGDTSLFISGFFSDSLNRKIVDIDYYMSLGAIAYGFLSRHDEDVQSAVFGELAAKFDSFVDVLSEVSERSHLTSNADLLRLYERWMRSGSRRTEERLVELGLVPNPSARRRFVQ
jgi:hypothetical protein